MVKPTRRWTTIIFLQNFSSSFYKIMRGCEAFEVRDYE